MTTSPIALDLGNLDQDRIALYQRFGDRVDPQPAYIEINENGSVSADYDSELGCELPVQVRHRLTLRVPVAAEVECGDLAAYLRGAALPLLQAIHDGHSVQWDGSDDTGTLTCEAECALTALAAGLQDLPSVEIWTVEDWLFGSGQSLSDAWPGEQTLDEAAAACEASCCATSVVVQGDAARALMDRARAEWRQHPHRLARAHVDALRAVNHISAQQAANWTDEQRSFIDGRPAAHWNPN